MSPSRPYCHIAVTALLIAGCASAVAPDDEDAGEPDFAFSGQVPNSGPPEVFPNPPPAQPTEPSGQGGVPVPPPPAGGSDVEPPPAGGALPPARNCQTGCQELVTCAQQNGRCPALPAGFNDLCLGACQGDPNGFLAAIDGAAGCDALIGSFSQDAEFCTLCHGDGAPSCGGGGLPPPEDSGAVHPPCGPVGQNLARCVIQACPAAGGALTQGLVDNLVYSCDEQWAEVEPQAEALAQAPCEQLGQIVDGVIQSMGTLCTNGPSLDAGTCAAGCQRYIGCLPPDVAADDPIRDPDLCLFACAVYPENAAIFSCAAAVGDCQTLQSCFQ